MPNAKLHLSLPEETWIHEVSATYPTAVFHVDAILSSEDHGTALLEIDTEDPVPIISDIERRDDVTEFDLLWKQDETTMIQIVTTNPLLLFPILQAGIPLQTPFEVRDGVAIWGVTTSSDRLSELGTRLDEAGIAFDIEYVRDDPATPADYLLTDRQREVLVAAAERGYYDTPRRTTLTDLSESLGISKATGSDVLHRAEGAVMTWFIDEHLTVGDVVVG